MSSTCLIELREFLNHEPGIYQRPAIRRKSLHDFSTYDLMKGYARFQSWYHRNSKLFLSAFNSIKIICAGHLFIQYVGFPTFTDGPSMLPLMPVKDYIWISTQYRRGRNVCVGDVVSFHHPLEPSGAMCKRIIAMEGDFVLKDTPGSESDQMIQVGCLIAGNFSFFQAI